MDMNRRGFLLSALAGLAALGIAQPAEAVVVDHEKPRRIIGPFGPTPSELLQLLFYAGQGPDMLRRDPVPGERGGDGWDHELIDSLTMSLRSLSVSSDIVNVGGAFGRDARIRRTRSRRLMLESAVIPGYLTETREAIALAVYEGLEIPPDRADFLVGAGLMPDMDGIVIIEAPPVRPLPKDFDPFGWMKADPE